jgi:Asp-tRNA(Asn)/Glu-tRNA(Gln) amidotransferase A subunit family amidase
MSDAGSAVGTLAALRDGVQEVARRCADAIDAREGDLHAFAWWDRDAFLARARVAGELPAGALRGLPVGVKDVIDTAGIPTERGARLFAGRVPDVSAAVVERIEAAGAVVAGKTVTAELAHAAPGPTRNPWDPERTPGGSSMGSAAGVAARMIPAAIGTQTNSSVIMPATLCGVVGFKPTAGTTDATGVMTFSESLDELGCFGATVADAAVLVPYLGPALAGLATPPPRAIGELRIGVAHGPGWPEVADAVDARVEACVRRLAERAGEVVRVGPPAPFEQVRSVHRTIMAREGSRNLGPAVRAQPGGVRDITRRFLEEGAAISEREYRAALTKREAIVEAFDTLMTFDVLLTTAAPDEAPGRQGTGDARCCTAWTLVGAPALALPCGRGPHGLPIGIQLVGRRGGDADLLAIAATIEDVAADLAPAALD